MPLTIAEFSEAKRLPVTFLESAGIANSHRGLRFNYGPGNRKRIRKEMGGEGWVWETGTEPCVAYTVDVLPDQSRPDGPICYVVEGESDSLTLWHNGFPAVGVPGNSHYGKITLANVGMAEGVKIWREPGESGITFADGAVKRLKKIKYRGSVSVVSSRQDKDASALWLRVNADRNAFAAGLIALNHETIITPEPPKKAPTRRMEFISAEDVECRAVDWIIPGWLPAGFLTLVSGDGRAGKSSLIYSIAADLSRGDCCLDLNYPDAVTATTMIVGTEDDYGSKVKPFLMARDADLKRIVFHSQTVDEKDQQVAFTLADADLLRAAVLQTGAKVVVFDPARALLPSGTDDYKDPEVRAVLGPLAALAMELGIAIILVKHVGKGAGKKATGAHLGSAAWRNVSRAAWLILRDEETENERVLFDIGASLSAEQQAIRYRIESADPDRLNALRHHPHFADMAEADLEKLLAQIYCLSFMGGTDANPDEMMAQHASTAVSRGNSLALADWLKTRLGREFAWPDEVIERESIAAGYTQRQYRTAKMKLKSEGLQSGPLVARGPWFVAFGDYATLPVAAEIPA